MTSNEQIAELMRLASRLQAAAYKHGALDLHAYDGEHIRAKTGALAALEAHARKMAEGEPVAIVERKEVHGHMCVFINRTPSNRDIPDGTKLYTTPQPAPQADQRAVMQQAMNALVLSKGALLEVSPCMEPECGQIQRDCIEAAERTSGLAIAALRQALAAKE